MTMSASSGSPCLKPNDVIVVCMPGAGTSPPKIAIKRSRSWWTFRSPVSTTTSASAFTGSNSSRSRSIASVSEPVSSASG